MNQISKTTPLPATTQDLLAMRRLMRERTLNDHVDDAHVALWADKDYRALLDAVYDEDAVEGSLSADNLLAAGMIRDQAKRQANPQLSTKKLATIVKALNVVLRRYGIARKDRAVTVGDEIMPANGE